MPPALRNNRGQSLVGVVVAGAIAIATGMAALSLIKYSVKGQRKVQSMADKTALGNTVTMILGNSALCKSAFVDAEGQVAYFNPDAGPPPAPTPLPTEKLPASIRYGTATVITVNKPLDFGPTVTGIGLGEIDRSARVVGSTTTIFAAQLSIYLDQNLKNGVDQNGNTVFAAPDLTFPLYVEADNQSGQIVNCGTTLTPPATTPSPSSTPSVSGSGTVIQVVYAKQASDYQYGVQDYSRTGLGITVTPKSTSSLLLVECTFNAVSPLASSNTFSYFRLLETTAQNTPTPTPDPKSKKTPAPDYPILSSARLFCASGPVDCYAGAPSTIRGIVPNSSTSGRTFEVFASAVCLKSLTHDGTITDGMCTVTEVSN